MSKKSMFAVLGTMLACIITSLVLVFTVGPLVSAVQRVGVLDELEYFTSGFYDDIWTPEIVGGLSSSGADYMSQFSRFNVTIPNGTTKIGNYFDRPSLAPQFINTSGSIFGYYGRAMMLPMPGEPVTEGITVNDYSGLVESLILPDSLEIIGQYALYGCNNLTSITIPDNVTTIGDYVFAGCDLTSMTIPVSVTTVGEHIFGEVVDEDFISEIIVQSEDLYNHPNLAEYKDAGLLRLELPTDPNQNNNNENNNQENQNQNEQNQNTEESNANVESNNKTIVIAVGGTAGGVAGLGAIGTIVGLAVRKRRK